MWLPSLIVNVSLTEILDETWNLQIHGLSSLLMQCHVVAGIELHEMSFSVIPVILFTFIFVDHFSCISACVYVEILE